MSRDKQDIDKLDQLLDEQVKKFPSGADLFRSTRQVPIRMIRTDIEWLHDERGANTGIIIAGICEVDGIHYAALCDARTPGVVQGHVEEVHLSLGKTSIKTVRMIRSPEEWGVIVHFFQTNNVWDAKRIFFWIWQIRNSQPNVRPSWLDKVNRLIRRGPKITRKELVTNSNRIISAGVRDISKN